MENVRLEFVALPNPGHAAMDSFDRIPMNRNLLLLAALASSAWTASGQQSSLAWSDTLMANGSHLYGAMVVTDAQDNVFVTGSYPNTWIITAKYDAAGNQLWQVVFDNPGTREVGNWIALDSQGNVVVAGNLVSGGSNTPAGFVVLKYDTNGNLLWSDVTPQSGGATLRVVVDAFDDIVVVGRGFFGTHDIVTMKYSAGGTKLWATAVGFNGTSSDSPSSLRVAPNGNIFVSGGGLGAPMVIAYDPTGTQLWKKTIPSTTAATDIVLDPAGNVIVSGGMYSVASGNTMSLTKLDPNGNVLWTKLPPGYMGTKLAIDSEGNLILTGYDHLYTDWVTHKLDANGNVLWTQVFNKHQFNDEFPYFVSVGPDDEIYITGQGGPGPTTGTLSYLRTCVVRYSPTGNEDWVFSTFDSLRGLGIARDSKNHISVVGESTFSLFHLAQQGVWYSTKGALPGALGAPRLRGTGTLSAGQPITLTLDHVPAGAPAWFIAGVSQVNLPTFGGILVPSPDLVLGSFAIPGTGSLTLPSVWPTGIPAGFEITVQAWLLDPTGIFGFTASNGLVGVAQ